MAGVGDMPPSYNNGSLDLKAPRLLRFLMDALIKGSLCVTVRPSTDECAAPPRGNLGGHLACG